MAEAPKMQKPRGSCDKQIYAHGRIRRRRARSGIVRAFKACRERRARKNETSQRMRESASASIAHNLLCGCG